MEDVQKMPLVSVIIPVYNGSNYMREAIDSALAQTYPRVEVLVINDGSNDDGETERIALSYGDRIRYFYKENEGVSSALNLGIRQMKGEYFSWLSHDDVYTPHKIARQMEALLNASDTRVLALCGVKFIDKNSQPLKDIKSPMRFRESRTMSWDEALTSLLRQGAFNGCALLIPKRVFEECGTFHEGLRYCQDQLMWMQIFLKKHTLVYLGVEDVRCRLHDGQVTQTRKDLFYSDSRVVGDILIPRFCEEDTRRYRFLEYFARYNAIYNNKGVVKDCLRYARENRLFPLWKQWYIRMLTAYGSVRPRIRKLYYRLVMGVKA